MRTPIAAQPVSPVVMFAAAMTLTMTLALIVIMAFVLTAIPVQAAAASIPQPAVQVVVPAVAPAPAATLPDDTDATHFESATHSAGVYGTMPHGAASHDPESAAGMTGTLMYAER